MIKLELSDKPIELTSEKEQELVDEFKANGTDVWRQKYITSALMKITHNKCAFSEQNLDSESAYMEIEHFKCKGRYPDDVVKWGNLLPCCKKCNTSKGTWDVIDAPLVNPLTDNPKDHFYIKAYRYYHKDTKGENTIDAYNLNDRQHFVNTRSSIGFTVVETLGNYTNTLKYNITNGKSNTRIVNSIKSLLDDCGRTKHYSAILSTLILYENDCFYNIEQILKAQNLWDADFDRIKDELTFCSLPK